MTKSTMSLAELAEKGADADLLREMIQFVAQRMMEMEVEGLCAATYGERSPDWPSPASPDTFVSIMCSGGKPSWPKVEGNFLRSSSVRR
jgi:hypothetical protein